MSPLLANAFENVGRTLLNFLAIGGGFLLGATLAWILVRVVTKSMFKKKPNRVVDKIARAVGGILGALLVALLVFGDGGWGFGGSGDGHIGGDGGSEKQQKGEGAGDSEPTKAEPTKAAPKPKPKAPEITDRVSIIILGGDARDDHFYLFESDTAPSTLQELTRKVEDRNNRMRLKVLTVKIYKNSAAEDGGVVGDVKDLAKEMKLDYEILHMRDQLRPK